MKRTLYHSTTIVAARAILRHGFKDGRGLQIGRSKSIRGVCLSNTPVDENEGAMSSEALIEVLVDLPAVTFAFYEVKEHGKPFREWLFPARLLKGVRCRASQALRK